MIEIQNVAKGYRKDSLVVENATCTIKPGDFFFLTGVSGSGKTTFFKLLLRIERPDRGSILFDGTDIGHFSTKQVAAHRRNIGTVFQNLNLLEEETVESNIALPLLVSGLRHKVSFKRVYELLELMRLEKRGKEKVVHLSGGEKQLVAIARALVFKPKVILADEPSGNLDIDAALRVISLLQNMNNHGCTVIISTHDLQIIRALKARTLLIKNKQLIEVELAAD